MILSSMLVYQPILHSLPRREFGGGVACSRERGRFTETVRVFRVGGRGEGETVLFDEK